MRGARGLLVCGVWAGIVACGAQPPQRADDGPTVAVAGHQACATADTHGERTVRRTLPDECQDLDATPGTPPTALFDPGDRCLQGTDVSAAQGAVPWRTLAGAGLEFVYVRASEGLTITDPHFARNWAMAKACGIPRGAYHVFEPGQDTARQIDHFLGQLGGDVGELAPVLDVEISPATVAARNRRDGTDVQFPAPADYVAALVQALALIERGAGGRPMIYIQPWYWSEYLEASEALTAFPLWAAGSAPRGRDRWPWRFWQHGMPAHWDDRSWDRDIFHGSTEQLAAQISSRAAE